MSEKTLTESIGSTLRKNKEGAKSKYPGVVFGSGKTFIYHTTQSLIKIEDEGNKTFTMSELLNNSFKTLF